MTEWIIFTFALMMMIGVPLFTVITISEPSSRGAKVCLAICVAASIVVLCPYLGRLL